MRDFRGLLFDTPFAFPGRAAFSSYNWASSKIRWTSLRSSVMTLVYRESVSGESTAFPACGVAGPAMVLGLGRAGESLLSITNVQHILGFMMYDRGCREKD
jgi:hypothetical protein